MMNSAAIKEMISAATSPKASVGKGANRPASRDVEIIKEKIQDSGYIDSAIKKIAIDLAREFF